MQLNINNFEKSNKTKMGTKGQPNELRNLMAR